VTELSDLNFPDDLRYTDEHQWIRLIGKKVVAGITDYAQDQMGDIAFVDLPEVGETFESGEEYGVVESSKTVSDLLMPISGEITAVNEALLDNPGLVNASPYGDGWLIEIKPDDLDETGDLLTSDAYIEMLEGLE